MPSSAGGNCTAAAVIHPLGCLAHVHCLPGLTCGTPSSATPCPPLQDLVGLLLHAQQAARLPPMAGVPQSSPPPILQQLRHLALIFPPRSVIPPTANLPDCLSTLTQACGLLPACLPACLPVALPPACLLSLPVRQPA